MKKNYTKKERYDTLDLKLFLKGLEKDWYETRSLMNLISSFFCVEKLWTRSKIFDEARKAQFWASGDESTETKVQQFCMINMWSKSEQQKLLIFENVRHLKVQIYTFH